MKPLTPALAKRICERIIQMHANTNHAMVVTAEMVGYVMLQVNDEPARRTRTKRKRKPSKRRKSSDLAWALYRESSNFFPY